MLLAPGVVILIEFKIGATRYDFADKAQTEAYAHSLRDFHEASQRRLVPERLFSARSNRAAFFQSLLLKGKHVARYPPTSVSPTELLHQELSKNAWVTRRRNGEECERPDHTIALSELWSGDMFLSPMRQCAVTMGYVPCTSTRPSMLEDLGASYVHSRLFSGRDKYRSR